jgi:phosphohistidine phosphatase
VETWDLVSEYMDASIQVEIRDDLYHASPGSLLLILQELPARENAVLLVGHNPAFEELALDLAGTGRMESLAELDRKYPTGALAVFDFSVDNWSDVREGRGEESLHRQKQIPKRTRISSIDGGLKRGLGGGLKRGLSGERSGGSRPLRCEEGTNV